MTFSSLSVIANALRLRRLALAVLLTLAIAGPAMAHDTWLLPGGFAVKTGDSVDLAMTSGMSFPKNGSPVAPDRIARTGLRVGGTSGELKVEDTREGALRLSAALPTEGVAVLWAVSRPRTLDLKPEEVGHYLEEIGAADTIGKAWNERGRPAWRETYSKLAKTPSASRWSWSLDPIRRPSGPAERSLCASCGKESPWTQSPWSRSARMESIESLGPIPKAAPRSRSPRRAPGCSRRRA
jgi:hypothetical protein